MLFHRGECSGTKFCPFSLGVAFGVTEALFMIGFACLALTTGFGTEAVTALGEYYYGYGPTVIGSLWGGLWGFVIGFVFGAVLGLVYNLVISGCGKLSGTKEEKPKKSKA